MHDVIHERRDVFLEFAVERDLAVLDTEMRDQEHVRWRKLQMLETRHERVAGVAPDLEALEFPPELTRDNTVDEQCNGINDDRFDLTILSHLFGRHAALLPEVNV